MDLLQPYAADAEFRILGYCLMPNHVHFVGIPKRAQSMPEALGRSHNGYAAFQPESAHLRARLAGQVLF